MEWHLLKLFGMSIFEDDGSGDIARLGEHRIGFRSSLDSTRLDPARSVTDLLLGD